MMTMIMRMVDGDDDCHGGGGGGGGRCSTLTF